MEIGSYGDYCMIFGKVDYNYIEISVKRFNKFVVIRKKVKEIYKFRNLVVYG